MTQQFPDFRTYRAHLEANPPGDDPLAALLPFVEGDPARWMAVGRQIEARVKDMSRDKAIASVMADLEAGRL